MEFSFPSPCLKSLSRSYLADYPLTRKIFTQRKKSEYLMQERTFSLFFLFMPPWSLSALFCELGIQNILIVLTWPPYNGRYMSNFESVFIGRTHFIFYPQDVANRIFKQELVLCSSVLVVENPRAQVSFRSFFFNVFFLEGNF